jgi:FixJ family two-component response regulator
MHAIARERLDAAPRDTPAAAIFVVDDDEAVRDSLQLLLTAQGLDATAFGCGTSALAAIERTPPACLIADLNMPGIDGIELLGALRARGIRLPVVLISGRIGRAGRQRALDAGIHVILQKPFTDDELIEAIRDARQADAEIGTIPNCRPSAGGR